MNTSTRLVNYLLPLPICSCQSHFSETTPAALPATQASASFIYDVPALLNQSLAQIEQQLGKPQATDTPNVSADELERTYTKQEQKLVITYNTKTRKAESFSLPASGPSETISNCNKLLVAGHLRPAYPACHIESLVAEKPGVFLGIVVTRNE